MADISEMLSQLLSSDEGKQQISQVLSMLGGGQAPAGGAGGAPSNTQGFAPQTQGQGDRGGSGGESSLVPRVQNQNNTSGGGLDLSALLSSLGGGGNGGAQGQSNGNSGGFDLSSLISSLGGGGNSGGGGGPDLSSLLSSLGGGGNSSGGGSGLPNLDFGKLLRVQQLLSQRRDSGSTALLRALKPHLNEENRKKADEAARILELLDLLPLIKESGLLGSLLGGDGE